MYIIVYGFASHASRSFRRVQTQLPCTAERVSAGQWEFFFFRGFCFIWTLGFSRSQGVLVGWEALVMGPKLNWSTTTKASWVVVHQFLPTYFEAQGMKSCQNTHCILEHVGWMIPNHIISCGSHLLVNLLPTFPYPTRPHYLMLNSQLLLVTGYSRSC